MHPAVSILRQCWSRTLETAHKSRPQIPAETDAQTGCGERGRMVVAHTTKTLNETPRPASGIARPRYHGQHVEVDGPEHTDKRRLKMGPASAFQKIQSNTTALLTSGLGVWDCSLWTAIGRVSLPSLGIPLCA